MQEFDQRIEQATRQERLDFLRGIAALYVLVNHCRGAFYIGGSRIFDDPHSTLFEKAASVALQVTSLGVEFVVLFFVLSGFAMAHSIRHTSDMGRFYLKRVVRIWPPYIAATLLALAIGILIGDPGIQARWLEVLFYLEPGTEVTPQFWSLPYEVLFYALCPFILATQGRVRLLGVIAAVLALGTIALFGLSLNPSGFLTNFLGNELLFFAAGALAYHHFDRVPRLGPHALLIAVAIGLAAMWAIKMSLGVPNMGSSLVMIGVAVLAIRNAPSVPRWANLGYFSYSIYIFHYALIALLVFALERTGIVANEIRNPFAWMLAVPLTLAGCSLLYYGTERLSNRAVERIRSKGSRPRAAPAPLPAAEG